MASQIAWELGVLITRLGEGGWEVVITCGLVSEELPPAERDKLAALEAALTADVKQRTQQCLKTLEEL